MKFSTGPVKIERMLELADLNERPILLCNPDVLVNDRDKLSRLFYVIQTGCIPTGEAFIIHPDEFKPEPIKHTVGVHYLDFNRSLGWTFNCVCTCGEHTIYTLPVKAADTLLGAHDVFLNVWTAYHVHGKTDAFNLFRGM